MTKKIATEREVRVTDKKSRKAQSEKKDTTHKRPGLRSRREKQTEASVDDSLAHQDDRASTAEPADESLKSRVEVVDGGDIDSHTHQDGASCSTPSQTRSERTLSGEEVHLAGAVDGLIDAGADEPAAEAIESPTQQHDKGHGMRSQTRAEITHGGEEASTADAVDLPVNDLLLLSTDESAAEEAESPADGDIASYGTRHQTLTEPVPHGEATSTADATVLPAAVAVTDGSAGAIVNAPVRQQSSSSGIRKWRLEHKRQLRDWGRRRAANALWLGGELRDLGHRGAATTVRVSVKLRILSRIDAATAGSVGDKLALLGGSCVFAAGLSITLATVTTARTLEYGAGLTHSSYRFAERHARTAYRYHQHRQLKLQGREVALALDSHTHDTRTIPDKAAASDVTVDLISTSRLETSTESVFRSSGPYPRSGWRWTNPHPFAERRVIGKARQILYDPAYARSSHQCLLMRPRLRYEDRVVDPAAKEIELARAMGAMTLGAPAADDEMDVDSAGQAAIIDSPSRQPTFRMDWKDLAIVFEWKDMCAAEIENIILVANANLSYSFVQRGDLLAYEGPRIEAIVVDAYRRGDGVRFPRVDYGFAREPRFQV